MKRCSTREEAVVILPDLRRRGVHRFLLVTSDLSYRARRAASILRSARAADLDLPCGWWPRPTNTSGRTAGGAIGKAQKMFVIEWMKTVANALGM